MKEQKIIQIATGQYSYIDKKTGEKMQGHSVYRLWDNGMIEKRAINNGKSVWVLLDEIQAGGGWRN